MLEVKSTELLITNVLDQYYSWLVKLLGPKGNDRIALLSTIVTHDIIKEAPLYTQGVFRGFADRTLTISPEDFGPGNTTDRYSRRYADLINISAYEIYAKATFTDKQEVQLAKLDGDVTAAITEINKTRKDANEQWDIHVKQLGLKPNTPEYDLERANFYVNYLELIRDLRQKITTAQAKKLSIMMAVFKDDHDAAQLSRVYERCLAQENIQYLPLTPDVEQTYHLDPIKIAEAAQSGLYPFERELGVDPSGSLPRMLDQVGIRSISISNDEQAEYHHDQSWNIGGSASSWFNVFSCDVGGESQSHFRSSLLNIERIEISCEYLSDYWLRRKDWFDSTIFGNKYVKAQLKNHPETVALLSLCISSAAIVRGLKVKYFFKNESDTTIWSNWDAHGSGGFTAWGMNFGVDSGGSGSSYSHEVNTHEKSVTFKDGSNVCRLLALRASTLIPGIPSEYVAFVGKALDESELGAKLIEMWKNSDIAYGQTPKFNFDAFGD